MENANRALAILHHPFPLWRACRPELSALQIFAQFARPVFAGGGHKRPGRWPARVLQHAETAAPFQSPVRQSRVNQQNRREP